MARLSDEAVTRIKREVSLVRLVESQGYKLHRHGKHYSVHCPFHENDKTPSLIITPDVNLFHCPACGAKGSVIDWVMKTEGLAFREVVLKLGKELPSVATQSDQNKKQPSKKKIPPLAVEKDHQVLLHRVIDYYHAVLKQSPEALDYLASRGLNDEALISEFKLGYANRTLSQRLPVKQVKAGAEIRGQLQKIGLFRQSGHEHFNGSIVVPVMNEQGAITEIYGRKLLGNKLRKGTPIHTYLPGPHQGVWNEPGLKYQKEIILCESLIDAMSFWVHGFKQVTASYGTAGFTDDHLTLFKNNGVERVLIAYDRDEAGNKAAELLSKKLQKEGIACFRVLFPKGMDANGYAVKVQPAQKSLGLVIRKAEWLGNGKAPTITTAKGIVDVVVEKATKEKNEAIESDPAELEKKETLSPLAASPLPNQAMDQAGLGDLNTASVALCENENEVSVTLGNRCYRVRGLDNNKTYQQLKVNLLVQSSQGMHMDVLDLYVSKQRFSFIKQASIELGVEEAVIKTDLGKLFIKLESLQGDKLRETLEPKSKTIKLDEQEKQAALALLEDAHLMQKILDDFERCGVVGEGVNKQVGYLAGVSRKLENPLAVMVQSSSAAGKTSLMESVLSFMPEEERVQYSAMTGQSLFYMGEQDLKHKILAIAEEEGASNASYALKLLQSEGQVSIASTGKNATTGNLETQEYKVEGPVMLFLTTTAIDIDEELLNRCITLSVDESREQTRAIHEIQRKRRTLEGQRHRKEKQKLIALHQNAQRLLRPLGVINPYADQLTFLDDKTRMRRDHEKYLGLIDTITLLHQYQREIIQDDYEGEVSEYVVTTLEDIALANELAHEMLGKTLDELPPQTRKLLNQIHEMVTQACQQEGIERSDYRFTRKQVREYSGWGNTQLKVHLGRLEEMEYVVVHGGSRGKVIQYEMIYNGEGAGTKSFLMGLIDVKELGFDEKKSGVKLEKSGSSRPQIAPRSEAGRGNKIEENPLDIERNERLSNHESEQNILEEKIKHHPNRTPTYPSLAVKAVEV